MWRRRSASDTEVTCIACGATTDRSAAREYDKEGDRWDRAGKEFEHLCKPCYRDLCHQPRPGLEELLVDLEAGSVSRREFLETYRETVEERERQPE